MLGLPKNWMSKDKMIEFVQVRLNARWIKQALERYLDRTVNFHMVLEVTREMVYVIELALVSGGSVSIGQAMAEALDILGYTRT